MKGGDIFESASSIYDSKLWITSSGSIDSPIVYTSYNGSRATIKADSNKFGIFCKNAQYVEFRSINITSIFNPFSQSGHSQSFSIGIYFLNDLNSTLHGIKIDSCKLSRFLEAGIQIGVGTSYVYGYEDIKITNCRVDSIGRNGINIASGHSNSFSPYPFKNLLIRNCEISRVSGLVNKPDCGDGILIIDVDSGLVDHNLVYSCGGIGNNLSGPSSIESAQCNNLIYQYNETYDQKSISTHDGHGMHFGDGVRNSLMQYNYSHDNDGPGYSCHTYGNLYSVSDSNNTIRYNLSVKNGRNSIYNACEISVTSANPKTIKNINIYNNTICAFKQNSPEMSAFVIARNALNTSFRNNIIYCNDSVSYTHLTLPTNREV